MQDRNRIRRFYINGFEDLLRELLVAVAALRLGMPEKAGCIASSGWG